MQDLTLDSDDADDDDDDDDDGDDGGNVGHHGLMQGIFTLLQKGLLDRVLTALLPDSSSSALRLNLESLRKMGVYSSSKNISVFGALQRLKQGTRQNT